MSDTTVNAAQYFGKLPCRSDFLCSEELALRRVFEQPIAEAMAICRQYRDSAWLNPFSSTGAVPFCLQQQDIWLGVLMPSSDAVGRSFPFVFAWRSKGWASPAESSQALRQASITLKHKSQHIGTAATESLPHIIREALAVSEDCFTRKESPPPSLPDDSLTLFVNQKELCADLSNSGVLTSLLSWLFAGAESTLPDGTDWLR